MLKGHHVLRGGGRTSDWLWKRAGKVAGTEDKGSLLTVKDAVVKLIDAVVEDFRATIHESHGGWRGESGASTTALTETPNVTHRSLVSNIVERIEIKPKLFSIRKIDIDLVRPTSALRHFF